MFEFITNHEERGQVGIGTLIVFIAMVLVAAIAAGVLINTAGFLQTQAEATGQESTDLVSERIDVTSEVGIVGSASSGVLDEVRLSVSGAPGADQIDLTETTIQAVGPGGQENLVFASSASGASPVTQLSVPQLDASQSSFNVTVNYDNIDGVDADDSDQKLVVSYDDGTTTDSVEVTESNLDGTQIDLSSGSGGDATLSQSLSQGDEVTVELADTSDNTIAGPVTQTVDPIQIAVPEIVAGDTNFDVNVNYDNITGLDSGDENQELVVEYDDGSSTETTRITDSDFSSTTITVDGDGTNDDTLNTTLADGDDITVTLRDDNDEEVNTVTQNVVATAGDGSEATAIQTEPVEVTAVFNNKVANLGPNEFAVGSDGNFRSSAVLNEEDDYTILINPDDGALQDTDDSEAFGEGDSATLDLVSPAGATTSVELRAPDLFNTKGEAVRL